MMENRPSDDSVLPPHIEETIAAIAELKAGHDQRGGASQTALRKGVAIVARPGVLGLILLLVLSWMSANFVAIALGFQPLDHPPFFWMDTVITVAGLCVTLTILTIQRRDDQLSALREQLALELAVLSEQKSAKIIQLLEALRRDSPSVPDRHDAEAAAMAEPADPRDVLHAIEDTHAAAGTLDPEIQKGN